MTYYFIHNGQTELGPFTFEELKEQTLLPTTQIWCEGMSGWTAAKNIDELRPLLKIVPPPFNPKQIQFESNHKHEGTTQKKSSFSLGRLIRKSIITIVILFVVGFCIIQAYPDFVGGQTYTTDSEKDNPTLFLNTDGSWRVNLIRQLIIEGKISNTATKTNYRDILVRVTCKNSSGEIIHEGDYAIDVTSYFGYSKNFNLKISIPKGVKSVGWEVIRASAF